MSTQRQQEPIRHPGETRTLFLPALFIAMSFLGGCQSCTFDEEEKLEDIRILGMRTEPAEIIYSGLYILRGPGEEIPFLPLPTYEVEVDVYAYDPRSRRCG